MNCVQEFLIHENDIPKNKVKKRIVTYISTNLYYSGMHWTNRNKIKDSWHSLIAYIVNSEQIKPYTVPVQIKIHWNTRYDLDNNGIMRKMIIDGLKESGIIEDDTKKHLKRIDERVWNKSGILVQISDYTED